VGLYLSIHSRQGIFELNYKGGLLETYTQ